jgi:ABC-type hemin transport system substrate-binding protein
LNPSPRIASLVPSLTELAVELGLLEHLVARTGFCIHPREALRRVAKVGGTKDVNLAKLKRLAPTHVLLNVDENRLDLVDALQAFVPKLVVTHPCSPQDNLALVDQFVAEFGTLPQVAARAQALRGQLQRELAATRALRVEPCQVLYLIWKDPWMTVARDTYISRLLACAGWRTWPDQPGGAHGATRYPALTGEEPWLIGVREVLLSSEPYAFTAQHLSEAQALCPNARVRLVDGELLSWYGPRTAAGLRYLRALAST